MIKSEKGSITVFTLSACLLMVFILVGIFMGSQNKIINQKKQLQTIEERYNDNNEKDTMAKMYEEALEKDINNIKADLKISTSAELKDFATRVNNGETFEGKTIVLMNDIDMSSVCSEALGSWIPIGNSTYNFKGIFNGAYHKINNIYIDSQSTNQGLFGCNSGTIKNIGIDTGKMKMGSYSGSIAGFSNGVIERCYNNVDIEFYTIMYGGGLVGVQSSGSISQSFNTGNISGSTTSQDFGRICGICGASVEGGKIEYSYNLGNVTVQGDSERNPRACGITDGKNINVNSCYNTGTITLTANTADCPVSAGLVGQCHTTNIYNSFNIGKTNILNSKTAVLRNGGITGYMDASNSKIEKSYWLTTASPYGVMQISGTPYSTYEVNEIDNESEIKSKALEILSTKYYKQDLKNINNGYPILSWQ